MRPTKGSTIPSGQVFRFGIQTGRCQRNPAPDLHDALQPVNVKHMAAVLEPARAGDLMRAIAGYQGQPATRAALALSALLFQRPGNIRTMEWADVDLDGAVWTIPAASMKRTVSGKLNGRPHLVPLAPQAVNILRDLRPLTGHGRLVFPGLHSHDRPMSENTVNLALRRLGFTGDQMSAHGFRAMARTLMVERTKISPDVIEAQLAHGKSGPLGAAYDRAEFMEQRRKMMVTWADYLDRLRDGAEAMRFARGHLPLVNLWYAKTALDHAGLQAMQENLSPGYLARIQSKARKDWGQDYWWAPGQAEPARAPDLSAVTGE